MFSPRFIHRSLSSLSTHCKRPSENLATFIGSHSLPRISSRAVVVRNFSTSSSQNQSNQSQTKSKMNYTWPAIGGVSLLALYFISTSEDWKMKVLRRVSLRWLSRVWGEVNKHDLPIFARSPLYRLWAVIFGANLDEASEPLEAYPNLQAFFTRKLKEGVRPLANGIVSPVDGTVACVGEVREDNIFIVKGLDYNVKSFLGDIPKPSNPTNKLFFVIFYLGPGDYHGIHAPCDWKVQERRHYPGLLLSVSGLAVKILKNLFFENERVILLGKWIEGYISVGMVGATNVGSIKIPYEKEFFTNRADQHSRSLPETALYHDIASAKGEEIGFFHLGSSVVMIFEHSADFKFGIDKGDKVKIGTALQTRSTVGDMSTMYERIDRSL